MRCTEFPVPERYVLQRRLGAGAIGVVFGALDQERGVEVALKVLQRMDSQAILQIKHEFRSLAEVSHPNLVSLYELASAGQSWFFTMELVDGIDFRSWASDDARSEAAASRAPGTSSTQRLRSALRQLAHAIACVHAAGKLHGDIKPTNVLVTPAGRVVLLDFGLVRSHTLTVPAVAGSSRRKTISGTPEYIAPELALGAPATPASDWYAMGAMLYEVLTGRLPFEGNAQALIHRKLTRAPPDARPLVSEGARDLADLAMRLLARDPERRPSAPEILGALGAGEQGLFAARTGAPDRERLFVGREEQLRILNDAFHASTSGRAVVALVSGPSGAGKSALCRHFLEGLGRRAEALVLKARCHERESVPHKTLDGLVDALAGELAGREAAERDALLPPDLEVLIRMFPVLGQVRPRGAGGGAFADSGFDARSPRRRAAAALREIISRLGRRRPLVVHIDDLQWGDADGVEVLGDLLTGGGGALWILSYRSEDEARSQALVAMQAMLKACGARPFRVEVGPLLAADSVALALRLLDGDDSGTRRQAKTIAREAAGNALFLSELARFERERPASGSRDAAPLTTLEELLRARISQLPEPSRRLLGVLAIAGRPLSQDVLRRTAEDPGVVLSLRNANLVRTSGIRSDDVAETYHDRIREIVVAMLSAEESRRAHAALAFALQQDPEPTPADVEAIARHALGAGDTETGLRYSLLAARQARAVYANRDAVLHYETALSLLRLPRDAAQRHALEIEAGEACREAGLYQRALELHTSALDTASDAAHRAAVLVGRGRVFQEKGDFRAAIDDLEAALRLLGRRLPGTGLRLFAATAAEMARYFVGRLLGSPRRPDHDAALVERQADVLFLLMRIYYFVDKNKIVWAGYAGMNLARQSEQDSTRAFARGYFGVLLLGLGLRRPAASHLEQALSVAVRSGNRRAEGVALGRLGTLPLFSNDLERAGEILHRSVTALKDVSETWELLTSLMLEATARFLAGRLEPAEELWNEMATVAAEAGGAMHRAWSLSWCPYVRYLRGAATATEARRELLKAVKRSRAVGDVANEVAAQSHLAAICVLERDVRGAAVASGKLLEVLSRYHVQVPFLQVGLLDAAEAALLGSEGALPRRRAKALQAVVRRSLRRARGVARSYPYLRAPLSRIRALEAAATGQPGRARTLVLAAVRLLEASPNRLWLVPAYRDAAKLVPDRREEFQAKEQALRQELKLGPPPSTSRASPPCA